MSNPLSICVFGNSHVASFKTAEAEIRAAHPDLEPSFFGVPWPKSESYVVNKRGLYAPDHDLTADAGVRMAAMVRRVTRINGRSELDVTAFDAVFWVGIDIRMRDIQNVLAQSDIEGFADRGRPCLMSRAAFEEIVADLTAAHIPDDIVNVANVTRCAAAAVPYPAEGCVDDTQAHYDDLRTLAATPADLDALMALVEEIVSEQFAARGVTYIPQRTSTTKLGFLSLERYSKGARRLIRPGVEFSDGDYIHMNADYAAESFNDFADFARAASAVSAITG